MRYALVLLLSLTAATARADADNEAACGGEPFRFTLRDATGRLYDSVESVTKIPVVLAFYQGYKSSSVLDNVRQALKADAVVGQNQRLGELWAGLPIIDFKEGWFVPGWAIDKALRDKWPSTQRPSSWRTGASA